MPFDLQNTQCASLAVETISMNTENDKTMKTVKAVSIAVCTVTTAVMCANLIAYSHAPAHSGTPSVKLIYVGHAPKVGHA